MEAARHPAAQLQPVLLTSCTILATVDITLVYLPTLGAERGIEASAIGLLLTIEGVASMTSRLFPGRLTALIGRRKLLITGTLVAAVALTGSIAARLGRVHHDPHVPSPSRTRRRAAQHAGVLCATGAGLAVIAAAARNLPVDEPGTRSLTLTR